MPPMSTDDNVKSVHARYNDYFNRRACLEPDSMISYYLVQHFDCWYGFALIGNTVTKRKKPQGSLLTNIGTEQHGRRTLKSDESAFKTFSFFTQSYFFFSVSTHT